MASLQEQIDDLRDSVVALQGSLATRALKSDMNTLGTQISEDLAELIVRYTDLNNCVIELQNELLAAREELIALQSS